jgi:hypothetical protein
MFGISPQYDFWVILLLLIALGLFLWLLSKLGVPIKKLFKPTYIVILILIIVLIWGWDRWGVVADHPSVSQMKWALFMIIFFGMLYLIGSNFVYEFRYNTTSFVGNGVHGSCALQYDMGKYTVFYLGTCGRFGINSEGLTFPWPFPNRIAICPRKTWDYNGSNPVSITQFQRVNLGELPALAGIKKQIEKDWTTIFARDNIFFGIFNERLKVDNPSYDELEKEMKRTNAEYNTMEEDFDDVTSNKEKYSTHTRTIRKLNKDENRPISRPPVEE